MLWWNATHEWRSFLFQGGRIVRQEAPFAHYLGEFLVGQALLSGPVLMVCSVLGMLGYFAARSRKLDTPIALPVLTSLPLLAYFLFHSLHSRVEANWTQPLLPAMTLVAVAWLLTRPTTGWRGGLRQAAIVVQPLYGLALIGLVYVQAIFQPFDLGTLDRTRMLRGWDALAAEVRQLADEAGAQSIWTDGNYRLTGELFFHGQAARDPRPVRDLARAPLRFRAAGRALSAASFPASWCCLASRRRRPAPRTSTHAELLGTIYRGTGKAREAYTVYAVSAPTADFPVAD